MGRTSPIAFLHQGLFPGVEEDAAPAVAFIQLGRTARDLGQDDSALWHGNSGAGFRCFWKEGHQDLLMCGCGGEGQEWKTECEGPGFMCLGRSNWMSTSYRGGGDHKALGALRGRESSAVDIPDLKPH